WWPISGVPATAGSSRSSGGTTRSRIRRSSRSMRAGRSSGSARARSRPTPSPTSFARSGYGRSSRPRRRRQRARRRAGRHRRVAVGRVTRAHGVRGEVSVFVLSEVEDRFEAGSTLLLEDGRPLTIGASRPNRGRILVKFEGIPDRTAAEALRGAYLFVPASEV